MYKYIIERARGSTPLTTRRDTTEQVVNFIAQQGGGNIRNVTKHGEDLGAREMLELLRRANAFSN